MNNAGFQRIEIIPKSIDVHFPLPERFVELTTLAGAAVMPQFTQEDPTALIEAISGEIGPIVQRYRDGDRLTFPMFANIAVASA